jgi:hypothetical protein
MSDFQEREYFLYAQQRFEAALAFAVAGCDSKGMATEFDIRYAVEQADRLIAKLEETRTKTNDEDTRF